MYKHVLFHKTADFAIRVGIVPGRNTAVTTHRTGIERSLVYDFDLHQHPFVSELVRRLVTGSIDALQEADTSIASQAFFGAYAPSNLVEANPPQREVDFSKEGGYAVYNWELFFHIPLTIAIHLSRNGRYEEAQRWFHYIFDPTDTSADPAPEKYWRLKPFRKNDLKLIEELLVNLSSKADLALRDETATAISEWKNDPFRPHVVASTRPVAYMLKTVMAYLDNLIDWGDSLFRQDTREAINDALQLYILAANLLGPRPMEVPPKGRVKPETYASLRGQLDELSNALRDLEADIPFDAFPHPTAASTDDGLPGALAVGRTLYFCVPRNDKLLGYWDKVADRLYKIRNSLNLQGVFRQLPLFPPPIDPALLAAAAAAGLDVAAIVNGAQQPLPLARYTVLAQKASELCQEVRSLGSQLLSAIEKVDAEKLAVMRAKHERQMLELAEVVRYGQWQEAVKAREGLEKSFANAVRRYVYYERLLGKQPNEIKVPALEGLDQKGLMDLKLQATEPVTPPRDVPVDIVSGAPGGFKISSHERDELNKLESAQNLQDAAAALEGIGAFLNLIPYLSGDVKPIGVGAGVQIGGMNLSQMFQGLAGILRGVASRQSYEANRSAKMAGYSRREQEWAFQSNAAAGEIDQIYKQWRAAQIREAIAEREWKNHQKQIQNAKEVEAFLSDESKGRTTTPAFYGWLKGELRGLYSRAFDLAYEVAAKAERALQSELGQPTLKFLSPTYLAGREGLLAGEKLYADLKRMEVAWLDRNARELELTKHVSLLSLNPLALLELRATGRCTVQLPESLFDLDGPGHYFRRIKSVAVSIPCVTGPYLNVSCKLTLNKSEIRTSPNLLANGYERSVGGDERFSDYFGSLDTIVTSSGVNDAGLFEPNVRDERKLPFEGHGAVSEWTLELPREVKSFDYDTISDVVLHVRYTARDGGEVLARAASKSLKEAIEKAEAVGSTRLFSVRHEFPSEWARFKASKPAAGQKATLELELTEAHYPYWRKLIKAKVHAVDVVMRAGKSPGSVFDPAGTAHPTSKWAGELYRTRLTDPSSAVPAVDGKVQLLFADTAIDDLYLAVKWGK